MIDKIAYIKWIQNGESMKKIAWTSPKVYVCFKSESAVW